jgi:hypothetical protein
LAYRFVALFAALALLCGCPIGPDDDDTGRTETVCDDGIDDEPDGLVDCGDPDCAAAPACTGADDDDAGDDDAGDDDAGDDDAGDDDDPCGNPKVGTGSMSGTITRTAPLQEDGVGMLLVAVFALDPIKVQSACEAALVSYDDVDLSASGASHAYSLPGIPPSATEYYVVALFDDNGDFGQKKGDEGPLPGDLMHLVGEALPRVLVPDDTPVTLDLVLNESFPEDE